MKHRLIRLSLTLVAALALHACGGGGSANPPAQTPRTAQGENPTPTSTATAQGTVYDASTGQGLAGASVSLAGQVLTTDSSGNFTLQTQSRQSLVAVASRSGYSNSQALVQMEAGSTGAQVSITLTPVGAGQTVSVAAGGRVSVPNSTAQVSLPAAGLVDVGTGQAATGNATVTVTPIDPAAQSRAMPGTYQAANGQAIESFGALQVTLSDATGRPLQLASGKPATIRIPLKTRSLDTPSTIPLYYLKESTGLWVEEGSATLKGNATSGFYYEGTVTHFTTWNADRPIKETVFVEGCVRDS